MSDSSNPVRELQQRLRRAGALLSEQQHDAALAEVDAALTIDPASLPAQALRERIVQAQARPVAAPAAPATPKVQPSTSAPAPTTGEQRFVPSGVDAQSWIGFEQRIQERRFRALLEQAQTAIAQRDGITARMAIEEARELRPDAPELAEVSARVLMVPMAMPAPSNASVWSRAAGAVALLLVGVAALLGMEWMRPVSAVDVDTPAAVSAPHDPITVAAPPANVAPTPDTAAPAPIEVIKPEPIPETPQTVATVGIRRAVSIERPVQAGPALRTFRPADDGGARVPPRSGEIPDDYIAPEYRRPSYQERPAAAPVAPPVAPPVTRPVVTPAVTSVGTTVATTAATTVATTTVPAPRPAAALASMSVPVSVPAPIPSGRIDESRVTQVLNQYARAYGQLDAGAARAVWPSVDERALARAFAGLESQNVAFDNCDVNVSGATATASCRGRASYVGKIGSREPRTEQRQWRFQLRRDGNDAWKIENAQAQRLAYAQ